MSEDKKQTDEKKYSQISQEFVRLAGECIGVVGLDDEVTAVLAEDVNYRLREAVQNAGQFMRHARRKKLTSEDFNKALRWSDVEPIYGHSSVDPPVFRYVKEAEVYCMEDHEINLAVMATGTQVIEHPGVHRVQAQWIAIEGLPKDTVNQEKKNGVMSPSVSDDMMAYYNQMTKAILGNSEEHMKVALEDLKSNSKIAPLLPYLINFVSVGVKKVSHDSAQLSKLLHTVRALISNRYLYLGPHPYLKLLVQGVLYCIVEPLAASINPINDHWALREYAAQLLVHIVRFWHPSSNWLYQYVLQALEEVFTDTSRPFSSHYGAVVALNVLGIHAVEKSLYPNLDHYWPHLNEAINDNVYSNAQIKADAQKVHGALLLAAETLILHHYRTTIDANNECVARWEPELSFDIDSDMNGIVCHQDDIMDTCSASTSGGRTMSTSPEKLHIKIEPGTEATKPKTSHRGTDGAKHFVPATAAESYNKLYDLFGDALAARLPCWRVEELYIHQPSPLVSLFTIPELSMSGEELLEAIEMKEEEMMSISGEDEHSDDDNSMLSDDPEQEANNVDLRIKSTVSDPTLGIKLTIAKLPRTLTTSCDNTASSRQGKLKKLSIKISKEQLQQPPPHEEEPFERIVMRPRFPFINLNFEGSMPMPINMLKRKSVCALQNVTLDMCKSQYYMLSLKCRKTAKHKLCRLSQKQKFYRAFQTGHLTSVL